MTAKRASPGVNVRFFEIAKRSLLAFDAISKIWQSGQKLLAV
jgi:hypothetical protein